MLYGAECLTVINKEKHLLNNTFMRMLRCIQEIIMKAHKQLLLGVGRLGKNIKVGLIQV